MISPQTGGGAGLVSPVAVTPVGKTVQFPITIITEAVPVVEETPVTAAGVSGVPTTDPTCHVPTRLPTAPVDASPRILVPTPTAPNKNVLLSS